MEIFNSIEDLRVVIRTPRGAVLDTRVTELEVEDPQGRFLVIADGEPALAALAPSVMTLRRRDGSEIHVHIGWGSIVAVGRQARIVVDSAKLRYTEPLRMAV